VQEIDALARIVFDVAKASAIEIIAKQTGMVVPGRTATDPATKPKTD
jgi:hypothetical protein